MITRLRRLPDEYTWLDLPPHVTQQALHNSLAARHVESVAQCCGHWYIEDWSREIVTWILLDWASGLMPDDMLAACKARQGRQATVSLWDRLCTDMSHAHYASAAAEQQAIRDHARQETLRVTARHDAGIKATQSLWRTLCDREQAITEHRQRLDWQGQRGWIHESDPAVTAERLATQYHESVATAARTLREQEAAKLARRDKYKVLADDGKLTGTITAARKLRKQRDATANSLTLSRMRFAVACRFSDLAAQNRNRRGMETVVPLGDMVARRELAKAKAAEPRLRKWSLGAEAGMTSHEVTRGSNSNWNKRSTFQRGVVVQCFATCRDYRVAVLSLAGKWSEIKAPRGYRWDIDANGLRLRSCSNPSHDYHPTASELRGPIAEIVAALKTNVIRRNAAAKDAKIVARDIKRGIDHRLAAIKRAEKEGATVCLRDSTRAGNCLAGSTNWATRHGLDPKRHYRPSEVLALANGDASRVAIVVTVALKRHREEMARGYSILAEHK